MSNHRQFLLGTILFGGLIAHAGHLDAQDKADPLTRMSLEYLMNVEVTTVSRQPERVQNAAAAVYVLTREEIQRAGVTSLPEALRLVPGVNVARINANSWAVSIRGFNSRFANKLLVMIDGRSIYSPLFSGVFWDRHNIPIDDIDRIEVVRGPGGTLWGANAVNGIISIVTRHSAETQGSRLELSAGSEDAAIASGRQGGVIGENATYRLSTKFDTHDSTNLPSGGDGNDGWSNGQANLRVDWTPTAEDKILLESGLNAIEGGERYIGPSLAAPYSETRDGDIRRRGAFVLGRWDRSLGNRADFSLQGFVDHRYMDIDTPVAEENRTTADIQAQHSFVVGPEIGLTWGGGYRLIQGSIETPDFSFDVQPESETIGIANAYLQASRRFFDEAVEFSIGSKFENHSITGSEVQPSARALWNVADDHAVWTAVSRAVRTPSRVETDGTIRNVVIPPGTAANPSSLPLTIAIQGSRNLDAETITAYEAGYRGRLSRTLSLDVAGFYNLYDGLLLDSASGTPVIRTEYGWAYLDTPISINEEADGRTYGFEIGATWQAADAWRLRGGYSWLQEDINATAGAEGNAPRHQVAVQSLYDISREWRFDTVLRFVDDLTNVDADAYFDVDARLSWSPNESIELALTGRNLLTDGRREFGTERSANPSPLVTEVARTILATLVVKF